MQDLKQLLENEATEILNLIEQPDFTSYSTYMPPLLLTNTAKKLDATSVWDDLDTNGWQHDYWFTLTFKNKDYSISGSAMYGNFYIEIKG